MNSRWTLWYLGDVLVAVEVCRDLCFERSGLHCLPLAPLVRWGRELALFPCVSAAASCGPHHSLLWSFSFSTLCEGSGQSSWLQQYWPEDYNEILSHEPVSGAIWSEPFWLLGHSLSGWVCQKSGKWDVTVLRKYVCYVFIFYWPFFFFLGHLNKGHVHINVMELWLYLGISVLFVNVNF